MAATSSLKVGQPWDHTIGGFGPQRLSALGRIDKAWQGVFKPNLRPTDASGHYNEVPVVGGSGRPTAGGNTWEMNAQDQEGNPYFGPQQYAFGMGDGGGHGRSHRGYGGDDFYDPAGTARPGRFGNYGGRFAPPSPNALQANGRFPMGSLGGFYQMRQPGSGPNDAMNDAEAVQRWAATQMNPAAADLRQRFPWAFMPPQFSNPAHVAQFGRGMFDAYRRMIPGMGTQPAEGEDTESGFMGLAKGGPARAIQPYIVGEKGPELFIPKVDGKVLSHKKTAEMLYDMAPQVLPPKARYAGGGVRASGFQLPPWAMQPRGYGSPWGQPQMPPWMQQQNPAQQEFQMLQSPALLNFWAANPNAPDLGLNSPLARFVRMGVQNRARWQSAREAVAATYAQQREAAAAEAASPGPAPISTYGTGFVEQGAPGQGQFRLTDVGGNPLPGRYPMSAPPGSMAPTFPQMDALVQHRQRRGLTALDALMAP